MMTQRGQYTNYPWNQKIAKQMKRDKRRAIIDLCAIIFASAAIGAFTMVLVMVYYPLPWW